MQDLSEHHLSMRLSTRCNLPFISYTLVPSTRRATSSTQTTTYTPKSINLTRRVLLTMIHFSGTSLWISSLHVSLNGMHKVGALLQVFCFHFLFSLFCFIIAFNQSTFLSYPEYLLQTYLFFSSGLMQSPFTQQLFIQHYI